VRAPEAAADRGGRFSPCAGSAAHLTSKMCDARFYPYWVPRSNRQELITRLIKEAREFRFCGPSGDTDEQTAVTVGYHHLVTQLKHLAGPILPETAASRLNSIKVDLNDIYSAYTARAEMDALLFDIESALDAVDSAEQAAGSGPKRNTINIRLIAVEAGDALKYDTTVNEIDRIGSAIFPFRSDEFPHDSITSIRAKRIYDWLMSLGKYPCTAEDRARLASTFLLRLTRDPQQKSRLLQILRDAGVQDLSPDQEVLSRFDARAFHSEVFPALPHAVWAGTLLSSRIRSFKGLQQGCPRQSAEH